MLWNSWEVYAYTGLIPWGILKGEHIEGKDEHPCDVGNTILSCLPMQMVDYFRFRWGNMASCGTNDLCGTIFIL